MRFLKYLGWGVVLLLAAGAIFQAIASSRALHSPPGALVDVGGFRMHLYCTGQGSPAAIMDSGFGDSWLTWAQVQPRIAGFTRVCSYDRAGMGWSDPSPHSRDSKAVASELHTLLHNAGVPPPYILVGHSLGGIHMRAYVDAYREDAAALVLVDSSHPGQSSRLPPEIMKAEAKGATLIRAGRILMPFGIPRLMGFCPPGATVECAGGPLREMETEHAAIDESFSQVRSAAPLGSLPLRVLSRDPVAHTDLDRLVNPVWEQLQEELSNLSTDSKRTIAIGSSHYIHRDRPELVIATVRELVTHVGMSGPKTAANSR